MSATRRVFLRISFSTKRWFQRRLRKRRFKRNPRPLFVQNDLAATRGECRHSLLILVDADSRAGTYPCILLTSQMRRNVSRRRSTWCSHSQKRRSYLMSSPLVRGAQFRERRPGAEMMMVQDFFNMRCDTLPPEKQHWLLSISRNPALGRISMLN